jgi:hypothetical protein
MKSFQLDLHFIPNSESLKSTAATAANAQHDGIRHEIALSRFTNRFGTPDAFTSRHLSRIATDETPRRREQRFPRDWAEEAQERMS